ncbi:uroporphyrinogen-III synthase [Propionibacteriaceae bacterium G1746]|uniref:uroporphyrinogen-III synthase n=1 Tax=Aestuariimicrobium sp. G57 TaxID=3418485 RepID=UPI003C1F79F9
MSESPTHTRVAFVGGGPGPAWLLTLAAVDALNAADEVIITSEELQLGHPRLHLRHVHRQPLAELNPDTLAGRQVAVVVWGDPLLDSAAAEVAAQCIDAGLEVDIIPGVAARTSLPEFAGVALAGGAVQLLTLVHETHESQSLPEISATGTVVLLARGDQLGLVAELAEEARRPAAEPVLVTAQAASPEQVSVSTTLGKLDKALDELRAPQDAVLVVVLGTQSAPEQRNRLNWYETKPLFGWRVLVPRTKDQAGTLTSRLASHGAVPEVVPTMSIEPPRTPQQLDRAITGLVEGRYRWIAFTSANAVRAIRDKFIEYGLDARALGGVQIAVVGAATAETCRAWGLEPDLIPIGEQSAAGLAAEFPAYDDLLDPMDGVLLPKADIATETLSAGLTDLGWQVEDVVAYRTVRAAPPPLETREAIKTGKFDAVVFTSSSTVRNLVGIAGKPHKVTIVAAIGPQTAETCREHGLRVDVQAENPSVVELADALARFAIERRADLVARKKPTVRPSLQRRRGRPVGS